MNLLLMALLITPAVTSENGLGTSGGSGVPLDAAERERPRLHGEISFAAAGALSFPAIGFGPGLHLELGAVLNDQIIISVRATAATVIIAGIFQAGVSAAIALTDQLQLGFGVTWAANTAFVTDQAGAVSFQFPIRLGFLTHARAADEVVRKGLLLGLEVGPGIAYLVGAGYAPIRPRPVVPAFSLTAMLTVGYAVW